MDKLKIVCRASDYEKAKREFPDANIRVEPEAFSKEWDELLLSAHKKITEK